LDPRDCELANLKEIKMGLPTEIVMPGDGAANPFKVPTVGQSRTYICTPGSAIEVPGEDAVMLRSQGWVGARNAQILAEGPTSARPAYVLAGQAFTDTTIGATVVYGGPKTGWLHYITGAPA
jgi:hypothetical protein